MEPTPTIIFDNSKSASKMLLDDSGRFHDWKKILQSREVKTPSRVTTDIDDVAYDKMDSGVEDELSYYQTDVEAMKSDIEAMKELLPHYTGSNKKSQVGRKIRKTKLFLS
ncbi:hypothetical protein MKX01_017356 [Papaver californicum]|nr:hypothetical protein MKX01_017356 [Papaver californicum]